MHKHIALPTDHICQVNDIVLTQLQLIIDSVSVIKGADRFYFRNQGSTPFHQYHPNTRKIFTWTSQHCIGDLVHLSPSQGRWILQLCNSAKAAVDKQLAHRSTTLGLNVLRLHFILMCGNNEANFGCLGILNLLCEIRTTWRVCIKSLNLHQEWD
jgi:hypothetical protein